MDDIKTTADITKKAKPLISAEETERRRAHGRTAIAENRLEGIPTSRETQAICDAYISGELEAGDLVRAYKEGRFNKGPQPAG